MLNMRNKEDMMAAGRQLINTVAIMRYLAENGPASQLQVVKDTTLKRTSIFNIFEQLDQAGLAVISSNIQPAGKGRPSQLWDVNPDVGSFFVAYLANSEEHYGVYDFCGIQQEKVSCKSAEKFDNALSHMIEHFRHWQKQYCFRGVIVVLPGAVEPEKGTVIFSRTWNIEKLPLASNLAEMLYEYAPDIPIIIENNARMAAWGEKKYGSCIGANNFITLHLNSGRCNGRRTPVGVGSGIILNGNLYGGHGGVAGELDNACYKLFSKIYSNNNFPLSLRDFTPDVRKKFAAQLAENFAHLVNYLAPERLAIIFDHETATPDFTIAFKKALCNQIILGNAETFPVVICPDGVGAIMRGAISLLREKYFHDSADFLKLLNQRLKINS
jgi:predicted NBD/HSP70 family sugar kinase